MSNDFEFALHEPKDLTSRRCDRHDPNHRKSLIRDDHGLARSLHILYHREAMSFKDACRDPFHNECQMRSTIPLHLLGRTCHQNALDLLQVIEVVAGEHANDVLDRFLAALGMHAVMLPLFGRERFE
jgi:hypothetical protein